MCTSFGPECKPGRSQLYFGKPKEGNLPFNLPEKALLSLSMAKHQNAGRMKGWLAPGSKFFQKGAHGSLPPLVLRSLLAYPGRVGGTGGRAGEVTVWCLRAREELQSVQRELEVLSEQYSQKCLENAHLAQALEAERQALRQCQRENQELNAHNQVRSCLKPEVFFAEIVLWHGNRSSRNVET